MAAFDPIKNFVSIGVSTGYAAGDTTIVVSSGQGAKLPTTAEGAWNAVWFNYTAYPNVTDDPNVEIVRVTSRSTDTLAITRAQEGTAATSKNTSGHSYRLLLAPTAKTITDISTAIQSGSMSYAADAVGADSYAVTLAPVPAAYTTGMRCVFKAQTANVGACSLNCNSLGAISLKTQTGEDPLDNTILANSFVEVVYDGSAFTIVGVTPTMTVNTVKANELIYFDAEYDNGNSSTADTISFANGNKQKSTVTGNPTYTLTPPVGVGHLLLKCVQGGSGAYVLDEVVTHSSTFAPADVNTGTYVITTGTNIATGSRIRFSNSGGALPTGLVAGTIYWAINASSTTIKVATTYALAIAGTNKTDISTQGTGTHTIQKLVKWAGGTKPTLSTAVGSVDILSFYYDGDQGYGSSSLAFS